MLEEMIRRMVSGEWAVEQIRLRETREEAVIRFMKQARARVRDEVILAAVARARREMADAMWSTHDEEQEPKHSGKFG